MLFVYVHVMQAEKEELGKAEARSKMEKFLANGMYIRMCLYYCMCVCE